MKNKTVLVTGGAGFIGSHLVDRMLAEGAEKVIALDNFVAGKKENLSHINDERLEIIEGDVKDYELMKRLVEKSDIILHEAASKLVVSLNDPVIDLHTNIIGSFNIFEAARKAKSNVRIIHASTGSVFGSSDVPMDENHAKNPSTTYGISKLAGEKYCLFYAKEYGIKSSVLRYFHVYGPRQDYHGDAGVVSIFLSRVMNRKAPIVYGTGKQIRCFTYVEDDADANVLLLKNNSSIGEDYNVASKERVSVFSLADLIVKKYGPKGMKIEFGPRRMGENLKPIPDTSKIEKLGFKAKYSFEDGLELTKKWVEEDMR